MTQAQTISADYTLRPSELAETLAVRVKARQPCMVWRSPGCCKSQVPARTADRLGYEHLDVRGPLPDPVDLRDIPCRDKDGRIRHVAAEIEPERAIVLHLDAALQDEKHYHPHELPPRIDVKGRYGTDFRPGFARLAEQGIRPAVCLYFTDMECDGYPETQPAFPALWCNFDPPPSDRNRPPWGELIQIAAPTTR